MQDPPSSSPAPSDCPGPCAFVQNRECPYFPCHPGADRKTFNCKHCYCPLYFIYWSDCGGTFKMLPGGIKDCTPCLLPHQPGGHAHVLSKLKDFFRRIRPGVAPCATKPLSNEKDAPRGLKK
ncbi:MAG: cysteine-rich small domain-containing protein [Desulfohalobiaceae bacterium]